MDQAALVDNIFNIGFNINNRILSQDVEGKLLLPIYFLELGITANTCSLNMALVTAFDVPQSDSVTCCFKATVKCRDAYAGGGAGGARIALHTQFFPSVSIDQYNSTEEHNQQEAESTEDPNRKPSRIDRRQSEQNTGETFHI